MVATLNVWVCLVFVNMNVKGDETAITICSYRYCFLMSMMMTICIGDFNQRGADRAGRQKARRPQRHQIRQEPGCVGLSAHRIPLYWYAFLLPSMNYEFVNVRSSCDTM